MKAILLGGPMDGELISIDERSIQYGRILVPERMGITEPDVKMWNEPIPIYGYDYFRFALPGKYGTRMEFFICTGKVN